MYHTQGSFDGEAQSTDSDIAIVGMAGRFAGAPNIDAYWRNLREGVESIATYTDEQLLAAGAPKRLIAAADYVKSGAPLTDMEMFDPALFGVTPREAAIMDPQHRHFLECAWEALENAGHSVERFAGQIGVFAGSGYNGYLARNLLTNADLVDSVGFFLLRHTGNDKDFLTTRVSYLLGLKGPSIAVQTACSTSLVAIHIAVQSLLSQECDMALAGGVSIELPHRQGYAYEPGGILSPDGHCRPFDANARGTVFGSGAGILVLRRLQDAIDSGDHIYAVIKGTAVNNDGAGKVGYLAPSVDGQANAILEALTVSGVPTESIGYVEAHGSGTPVGDPIEMAALTQAFRRGTDEAAFCAIGSVKGNIGHTDTAAGVAGVIKVALSLHHGELPPSLNFQAPNEACGFDKSPFYVNDTLKSWPHAEDAPRRAGVSSLGVGGTNAHLIMEEAPARAAALPSEGPYLLVLSAASDTALVGAVHDLGEHLRANPTIDLADVEHTLQVGRRTLSHRRCLVVTDREDAIAALSGTAPDRAFSHVAGQGSRSVAFMFAGGGAQHPNMGLDLYRSERIFREAVDTCLAILVERCDCDIRSILYPQAGDLASAAEAMQRPSIGLPALFVMQYAQALLWRSWGITPNGMIGHSMGEYIAAHLAGVFSLTDALRLVHLRGRLFETLPPGAMLSVPMPASELAPLIPADLSVAATNGPKSTVVSGPGDSIEALRRQLDAMEMPTSLLHIAVAAHSAMLEPILGEFGAFLAGITFGPPTLPFVSSLTGTWITKDQATDPTYWVRHLREPVRFDSGLAQLLKDETRDLLEVGPGRTLTSLALQNPNRLKTQSAVNASRHPDERVSDKAHMLGALGRLWAVGAPVLFGFVQADGQRRFRVPLPSYHFDHQRYWIEPGRSDPALADLPEDPLARRAEPADWFYRPVWHKTDAVPASENRGRMLVFADESGVAEAIAELARLQDTEVVFVRPGRHFMRRGANSFVIDAAAAGDYVRLFAELANEARLPERIFHLWSVTGSVGSGDALRTADRAQTAGFFSLLHLGQAIGLEDLSAPIDLVVVSDGMQRVCGETDLAPAKATLLGPCRVIPQEFGNVRVRSVDIILPRGGSPRYRSVAEAVMAEPESRDQAETVAIRSGERWVQRFEPITTVPTLADKAGLRADGTYLITGGLGEIGLAVARHVAETVRARLVLLAREPLPPREQWLSILAAGDSDSRMCRRIRAILAIEELGSEVLVLGADVADPAQMRRAVRQARAQFGAIHGAFHTAGVLNDAVLQMKTDEDATATLAPKVRGTLVLQAALAEDRPDFVMLFSSTSAALGAAGQVDYAAANAFLDAFAQACAARDDGNVVAVNWSQWREIGMAAALARAAATGDREAAPPQAGTPARHPLIDRCVRARPSEYLYATRFSPERHWLLDEHRTIDGRALIPGTGFLEIVRAAAEEHGNAGTVELDDVLMVEPFFVDDASERELFIRLHRKVDGGWSFELGSETDDAGDAAPTIHVSGTLRHIEPVELERLAIPAIRARSTEQTSIVPSRHMRFGPRWNNVVQIDRGDDEALIELAMPAAGRDDPADLELHPALFDMATAGAQMLLPHFDPSADFFVPASYDRIRLHRPLTHRLFSHVRLRQDNVDRDVAIFDVTIADDHGLVLVEAREFTMVRLHDGSIHARSGAATILPGEHRTPLSAAHAVGILPAEGMAVIDRILAGNMGAQIVVSPQDFPKVLAKARAPLVPPASRHAGSTAATPDGTAVTMTATETLIAALWQDILGIEAIGPDDNFFDLGGH